MFKITLFFTIIGIFILSSFIITNSQLPQNDNEYTSELLTKGTSAMDWTLKELISDQTMSFSSFQGKVVLIDFFATWCGPCETAIPHLITVRNSFSTSKLVIISIDTDPTQDSEATIESFVAEKNMNWYIFKDTESISSYYQISSIPTFYIIDQNQDVYFARAGIVESTTLVNTINQLVGSPTTTSNNNNSEGMSDFWQKNWYWIIIVVVFAIVGATVLIQRQRIVNHNKKVEQQRIEQKKRKSVKRKR
ncbi:MAG: TlpA family protein disulfide reductase [Candidatus Thorarchaeota archaeon]